MKDKYEELAKKYSLPSYDEMVRMFEIDSIGKEDNFLREILKKMYDKVDFYTRTMESLIQPESSYGNMKEASGLSIEDQSIVKKLYIEGMYLIRQFTEFTLDYSNEDAAKFINHVYSEWKKMRPELKIILEKIKNVWKKVHNIQQDKGYFG